MIVAFSSKVAESAEPATRYLFFRAFQTTGTTPDPTTFVNQIDTVFGLSSLQKPHIKMGFSWELNPLEWNDAKIKSNIDAAFLAANNKNVPFVFHVNLEWIYKTTTVIDESWKEWSDWSGTKKNDFWVDWSICDGNRQPTQLGPRMAFNNPSVRTMLATKIELIKARIADRLALYPATSSLFIGVDTSWETGYVRDCKTYTPAVGSGCATCTGGQLPAYQALHNAGYNSSSFPGDETDSSFNTALRNIAADYLGFVTAQFSLNGTNKLAKSKVFTHILVLADNSLSQRRQPVIEGPASTSTSAISGFSTNDHTLAIFNRVKSAVGATNNWVIAEAYRSHYSAARLLLRRTCLTL